MASRGEAEIVTFNRGVVSALAQARTDIKRVSLSAEIQENWVPRVLGPMSLRAGQEYITSNEAHKRGRDIPFIFATDDVAIIRLTENKMRVLVNDALVSRPSVSSAVTNGTFTSDLTGWTDNDEAGATSQWLTGGFLSLSSGGTTAAIRDQQVTVAGGDQGVLHALRIVVTQGDLILRVGTSAGTDNLVGETVLRKGAHSITFTPTGNFHVRLMSRTIYPTLVDSVTVETGGIMELPTPWNEGALANIAFEQSGDVVFVVSGPSVRPMRIERRPGGSWSVVDYINDLGPFRVENSGPITLTPSALIGAITLTASAPLFRVTNVGGLYYIQSAGQVVQANISTDNVFTDNIRVTGTAGTRRFAITITGTWSATITLQRSVGNPGNWVDVATYTTNQATTLLDGLDNQTIFYRIGIKAGQYTSGTATAQLAFTAGTIRGIARVTGFVSETVVNAIVVKAFGALAPSGEWAEGAWSPRRGYPTAVALHEGRLCFAGRDKIDLSVSDDFSNFSNEVEGDSGPISRSIGSGPVDTINWLLSLRLMLVGGQGAELSCRSSSLGEPLTPSNFNLKETSSLGSMRVQALKLDQNAIFADRSQSRVFELEYDGVDSSYAPIDLTAITPEIAQVGIVRMAIQRRPDTRIHVILADGRVALLVYDRTEEVRAWVYLRTEGEYEDVVVLPGLEEDRVYYTVKRTINGNTARYLEKVALQTECEGGPINKQADSFVVYQGTATDTISGLDHLEGENVVVWADGVFIGAFEVASGSVTLSREVENAVLGLGYQAWYRSAKLGQLSKRKNISRLALLLHKTHYQGVQYGQDFDYLDELPLDEFHEESTENTVWDSFDRDSFEVNGMTEPEARLCLTAQAPKPATILAAVIEITTQNG